MCRWALSRETAARCMLRLPCVNWPEKVMMDRDLNRSQSETPRTPIGDKLTLAMVPAPMHHGNEGPLARRRRRARRTGNVESCFKLGHRTNWPASLRSWRHQSWRFVIRCVPCNRPGPRTRQRSDSHCPANVRNQTTATHYYGTGANLQTAINNAKSGRHPGGYVVPVSVISPIAYTTRRSLASGA